MSLCKAAQVSRKWREMADDDIVWMKICQQHIDRKCTKCGWGLPLLERRRLRAATRAANAAEEVARTSASVSPVSQVTVPTHITEEEVRGPSEPSNLKRSADDAALPCDSRPPSLKRSCSSSALRTKRPWKTVYSERCKIEQNWRHGRYSVKVLRRSYRWGHVSSSKRQYVSHWVLRQYDSYLGS